MQTMSFVIREATINDSVQIVPLMNILQIPQSQETIKQAIIKYTQDQNYKFFVAEKNKEILGIVTLYISYLHLIPSKKCYIETLVVSPLYQRQNVGKELLEAAEKHALDNDCDLIELISANWRKKYGVHEFYIKNGYINQGDQGISYFYKSDKKLWQKS